MRLSLQHSWSWLINDIIVLITCMKMWMGGDLVDEESLKREIYFMTEKRRGEKETVGVTNLFYELCVCVFTIHYSLFTCTFWDLVLFQLLSLFSPTFPCSRWCSYTVWYTTSSYFSLCFANNSVCGASPVLAKKWASPKSQSDRVRRNKVDDVTDEYISVYVVRETRVSIALFSGWRQVDSACESQ